MIAPYFYIFHIMGGRCVTVGDVVREDRESMHARHRKELDDFLRNHREKQRVLAEKHDREWECLKNTKSIGERLGEWRSVLDRHFEERRVLSEEFAAGLVCIKTRHHEEKNRENEQPDRYSSSGGDIAFTWKHGRRPPLPLTPDQRVAARVQAAYVRSLYYDD